jgi:hypothetical protein
LSSGRYTFVSLAQQLDNTCKKLGNGALKLCLTYSYAFLMIVVVFAMCKKKDGYANSEYEHMTVTPQDICGIDIHPSLEPYHFSSWKKR